MTKREDMEKAFSPVLSDFNFIVVVGYGQLKMPLVYAFKPLKILIFRSFSDMVGGQAGQIIQSPPE